MALTTPWNLGPSKSGAEGGHLGRLLEEVLMNTEVEISEGNVAGFFSFPQIQLSSMTSVWKKRTALKVPWTCSPLVIAPRFWSPSCQVSPFLLFFLFFVFGFSERKGGRLSLCSKPILSQGQDIKSKNFWPLGANSSSSQVKCWSLITFWR